MEISYIAQIYVDLIHKGKRTIEEAPEKYRQEVESVIGNENIGA